MDFLHFQGHRMNMAAEKMNYMPLEMEKEVG